MISKDEKLLVILGPSGAGKSSIIKRLIDDGVIEVTPTWTTRPRRTSEEVNDPEHIFVTSKEFETAKKAGKFLHSASAFGLGYEYGLPAINKPAKGKVPTVMLRVMVIEPLFSLHSNFVIYEIDAPLERVETEMKKRFADGDELGTRLSGYKQEVEAGRKIANRVFINDKFEEAYKQVKRAIVEDFGSS